MIALELELDREAPAKARAALEPLRDSLPRQDFGDLRLLVSELIVDDLLAHGAGDANPIRLRADVRGETLRLELAQGWTETSEPVERPEPGELGWGLYLAGVVADRWGIDEGEAGNVLWLERRVAGG